MPQKSWTLILEIRLILWNDDTLWNPAESYSYKTKDKACSSVSKNINVIKELELYERCKSEPDRMLNDRLKYNSHSLYYLIKSLQ